MAEWGVTEWLSFGWKAAAAFAIGGGLLALANEGASWNGFVAGLWKGVEWFLIIAVSAVVLFFAWLGIMTLASSLNSG